MKKFFLYLLIHAYCLHYSQSPTLLKSAVDANGFGKYIGQNEESVFFAERLDDKSFLREVTKSDLKLAREIQFIEPESKDGDLIWSKFVLLRDKVYYLEGVHMSGIKMFRMYASLMNKNGTFGERVLLAEKQAKKKKNAYGLWDAYSNDNTKLIIHTRNLTEGKDNVDFTISVLDENLARLSSKTFSLAYSKESSVPEETQMEGDNIYFTGEKLIDPADKKEKSFKRKLFAYNIKTDKLNEFTLGRDSLSCYSYSLYIRKGEVVVAGIYTDLTLNRKHRLLGEKCNYLNGLYYASLSPSLTSINVEKFIALPTPDKANRDPASPNAEFYFSGANFFDDGSVALVTEQHDVIFAQDGGNSSTTHRFKDVFVFNISPSGEKNWTIKLEKNQVSSSWTDAKKYHSFLLMNGGASMQLLLNAKPFEPNVTTGDGAKILKLGYYSDEEEKGTSYLVSVSSTGNIIVKEVRDFTSVMANKNKVDMGKNGVMFQTHADKKFNISKIFYK